MDDRQAQLDNILFGGNQASGQGDELDQILFGNEQQQQQPMANESYEISQDVPQKSPLSFTERLMFGFADNEESRRKFLKDRFKYVEPGPGGDFLVGDDMNSMVEVDPDGIMGDALGELADITNQIPIVAGQIAGGILGSAGGPAGTVGGAAAGTAAGSGLRKAIGGLTGVNQQEVENVLGDIAIDTAFGALGEGVGVGIGLMGKGAKRFATRQMANNLGKIVEKSQNPSRTLKALSKVFKITASIPEEKVINAGLYDFNKVLTPKYLDEDYITKEIMPKFVKGIIKKNERLGQAVGAAKNWAKNTFGNTKLEMRGISQQLLDALSDPRVGILDDAGRLTRGAFTEPADYKTFKELTELFFSKNPKTGQVLPKNLTLKQFLDYKDRMGGKMTKFFQRGAHGPGVEPAFAGFLNQADDLARRTVAELSGTENNVFSRAMGRFSDWKNKIDLLKKNGLDVTDVSDLKNTMINGKVVSSKVEKFTEGIMKKSDSTQEAFRILASELDKIPGGGIGGQTGTLTDELVKWDAAQGFKNSNPNMLRIGAIASILGGLGIVRGEIPKPYEIGGALALGTPAGAKFLLKGGALMAKGAKASPSAVGRKVVQGADTRAVRAMLSRLMEQKYNEGR